MDRQYQLLVAPPLFKFTSNTLKQHETVCPFDLQYTEICPLSSRKVVDANHRERWVSNNTYWELRKNPGFINMESAVSLW